MIFFIYNGLRRFSSKWFCLILHIKTNLTSLNRINRPWKKVWNCEEKRKKCSFVKINSKYIIIRYIDIKLK